MKPTYLGLRTCIYKVEDINKAKAWYAKAFETEPYFDEPFYVGFNIGGFELGLQPVETTISQRPDNVVCYWGVEDVQAVFKSLILAGASMHEKPQNVGGEIVVASVKDPWGNVIGIIYNPEFKG
jgi:lactoylglutathione lyase